MEDVVISQPLCERLRSRDVNKRLSFNTIKSFCDANQWPLVETGDLSPLIGRGVFAKSDIKPRTIICTYRGMHMPLKHYLDNYRLTLSANEFYLCEK